jgi:uncharacterized protein (DUF1800 family)
MRPGRPDTRSGQIVLSMPRRRVCYRPRVVQQNPPQADDAQLAQPMTAEEAAHLLRRTRFVASPDQVANWTGHSWNDAIAALVDAAPDPSVPTPQFAYRRPGPDDDDTDATLLLNTELDRLTGPIGLGDRLLWFWHGLFTSSQSSVDQPVLLWRQHQLLARHSLGNVRQLAIEVSTDPAMLIFLSGDGSWVDAPNENYARELMELFTLGRGNYSQADVVAGARVLSGWEVQGVPEKPGAYDPSGMRAAFSAESGLPGSAKESVKNGVGFLGGTGVRDIPGLVDQILAQPACASFIAHKLCTTFLQAHPSSEDEAVVATALLSSGFQIRAALATLFRLPAFRAEAALRERIRQPLELLLQACAAFGVPATPIDGAGYLDAAGNTPFDPPNVAGWPIDPRWLTSPQALARVNLGLRAYDLPADAPGVIAVARADDPVHLALQRVGIYRVSSRTLGALHQAASVTSDPVVRARTLLAMAIAAPEMALT